MVRRGKQFGEAVLDVAHNKLRAAAVRFGRAPVLGEAPRTVYAAACQSISDALSNDGFEYARSRATLTRRSSDFAFHIYFQSSHHNVAGELVMLWIHAGVTSQALKRWRARNPCLMGAHDIVAGGQIGNLVKPESWMEWNLASEEQRGDEIADAVAAIHELAYPYFELFDDIAAVRTRLVAEDIPSMRLASALDFLMCFGSRDEVLALARRVFLEKRQILDRYCTSLAQYRSHGVPRHPPNPYGDVLAAATLVFGLPDLEAPDGRVTDGTRSWRYADADTGHLNKSEPLSKAERKARRALSKTVGTELGARAKATGWKVSQGWLFREDHGWFVDVRPMVHVAERKTSLELRAKPMSIDPVFWEIVHTQDNRKLPLSFRLFGAWTVSTPAIRVVEIDEGSLDTGGLADAMLKVAQREIEQSRLNRTIESFLAEVQQQHSRLPSHPYLPAIVCSLVVLDRREEARAVCVTARAAQESGGFMVGSRTFGDLAISWLDKIAATNH
jgi:hypothetical protein